MTIRTRDIAIASTPVSDDVLRIELSVPSIHCGGCIKKIENALMALPEVCSARVNLSAKRVSICFLAGDTQPAIADTLDSLGFNAHITTPVSQTQDEMFGRLLRALAVAGFAAMNVMMLSVAVWAGAESTNRQLFHILSGAIALPALMYSGRIFFLSAWRVLRHGRTNMDVPISIGLILTYIMSAYDTLTHGEHAYFDAATSLLFFLLIGRTLDHMMRLRAMTAIADLEKMAPLSAAIIDQNGASSVIPVEDISTGMVIQVPMGERIPVNGVVKDGISDIDMSLLNGESDTIHASQGTEVLSGALNLTGPLRIIATAPAQRSFLADMIRLLEAAEQNRGRYRRWADRIASHYTPIVHIAALAAFGFWMIIGSDLHQSLTIAVSVLIITCPCALALAVPMVQVRASGALFKYGILMKDGSALERLSEIDTIVMDKTGTLTTAEPTLVNKSDIEPTYLEIASKMATISSHPQAKAISAAVENHVGSLFELNNVREIPGAGIEAHMGGHCYRLGSTCWAVSNIENINDDNANGTVLSKDGAVLANFEFLETLKAEAQDVIQALRHKGLSIVVASGDIETRVKLIAERIGVTDYRSQLNPKEKVSLLNSLRENSKRVLMIGDGVNDSPALASAHVSMAPSNASDIGRNAADFAILRDDMKNILRIIDISKSAKKLTIQNIALALTYNIIAIPFAFSGIVTPLFAAIAMSSSSLIVVANAMRLSPPKADRKIG